MIAYHCGTVLPTNTVLDLINVAFETAPSSGFDVPDRNLALRSFSELRQALPERVRLAPLFF